MKMTGNILEKFETEAVKLLAEYITQIESEPVSIRKYNIEMKRDGVRALINNMGLNYNTIMLKAYEYKRLMKEDESV